MTTYHLFKERIAKIYTADRHVVTWCGLNSESDSFCYTTHPKSADCLECKARELEHKLWKEFHSSIEKDIRNMIDIDLRSVITSTKLEDIGKVHAKDVLTAMVAADVSDLARRSVINQLHSNSMRAKAKRFRVRDLYPASDTYHGKMVEYAGTVGVFTDMYYVGDEHLYALVINGKIVIADPDRNILIYPDN